MIDPALFEHLPLITDGDPRTVLPPSHSAFPEGLVLSHPETVSAMHCQYFNAGARLVRTLTAGAEPETLASHDLTGRAEAIHVSGHALARGALQGSGAVMAPLRLPSPEAVSSASHDWEALFGERIVFLSDAGIDFFLLEHIRDPGHAAQLIATIKKLSDAPVLGLIHAGPEGGLHDPKAFGDMAKRLVDAGANALGLGCVPPDFPAQSTTRALEALGAAGLPLGVLARSGPPETPEAFAGRMGPLAEVGALVLGGCCGTTPAHIAVLQLALHGEPPSDA